MPYDSSFQGEALNANWRTSFIPQTGVRAIKAIEKGLSLANLRPGIPLVFASKPTTRPFATISTPTPEDPDPPSFSSNTSLSSTSGPVGSSTGSGGGGGSSGSVSIGGGGSSSSSSSSSAGSSSTSSSSASSSSSSTSSGSGSSSSSGSGSTSPCQACAVQTGPPAGTGQYSSEWREVVVGTGGSYIAFTILTEEYVVCRTFKGKDCFSCPDAPAQRCTEYAMCGVKASDNSVSAWIAAVFVDSSCGDDIPDPGGEE